MTTSPAPRAEIVVDLAAIRHNVRVLRRIAGVVMITVVKADGYGHGMAPVARAAREAGSEWLAVATPDEARALRAGGDDGAILCWLTVPGEDYAALVVDDIDVTAYSVAELDEIAAGVATAGRPARVQLKVDTGLMRGGARVDDWERLFARARTGERDGHWEVTGVWSHFACADAPTDPANNRQQAAFDEALRQASDHGLRPTLRHLANSAATILRPSSRYDAVRCGIATYGLDPAPGATPDVGLVPAMTVRSRLALVKTLEAGDSVSYGHQWTAERATTIGVVPTGYGEGVPVHATNVAEVAVGGKRRRVRGRVCMDQIVVDLDGDAAAAGDEVVLFGTADAGQPTAQDWAEACGTINYEIVTRIGGRMTRTYVDSEADQ